MKHDIIYCCNKECENKDCLRLKKPKKKLIPFYSMAMFCNKDGKCEYYLK